MTAFDPLRSLAKTAMLKNMRLWCLIVAAGLSLHSAFAQAAPPDFHPVPTTRQLRGITETDATALIAKLEDAQRRLKAGEPQYFELLAGAIAFPDMLQAPPRDVFLQVPFKEAWHIERIGGADRLFQRYRMSYAPNGLGKMYWDVEVSVMFNERLIRVEMTYKPPAPF